MNRARRRLLFFSLLIVVSGVLCLGAIAAQGTSVAELPGMLSLPLTWPIIFILPDEADEQFGTTQGG